MATPRATPLLLLVACLWGPVPARAQQIRSDVSRCEWVQFHGDTALCVEGQCDLYGNVHIACDETRVWGDEARITWDQEEEFSGALVEGNVVLVDGATVVRCNRVTLSGDRIQGRIDSAAIRVKDTLDPRYQRNPEGFPQGPDQAIFHGDVEKVDEQRFLLKQGDFTVCDCGDAPPSWLIRASEIDANMDDRATIWWPTMYINPFALGWLVPITPPLLPLSVPLKKRAPGLLQPEILFLGLDSPWPTVDLPFFVPLGDSWDITIKPGLRADWTTDHQRSPKTWGAPRLGGRLRYAPATWLSGELNVSWTHDGRHAYAARQEQKWRDLDELASHSAELEGLRQLENRVKIDWQQRVDVGDQGRWLLNAEWLSDDLVQAHFGMALSEQVATYLPSRTQLAWNTSAVMASASADYLLRTDNAGPAFQYSNIRGQERLSLHRGPALRVSVPPIHLGAGILVDADTSMTRYGPWLPDKEPELAVLQSSLGFSTGHNVGPVRLWARAATNHLFPKLAPKDWDSVSFAMLEAKLETTLVGAFGATMPLLHSITPSVRYVGIPWVKGIDLDAENPTEKAATSRLVSLDRRFQVKSLHQMMVGLDQALWRGSGTTPLVQLSLNQPIDLETAEALETKGRLQWSLPSIGHMELWATADLRADKHKWRGVGGSWRRAWGPVSTWMGYTRWASDAEQFRRGYYELSAPRLEEPPMPDATNTASTSAQQDPPPHWFHELTAGFQTQWRALSLGYNFVADLPLPQSRLTDPFAKWLENGRPYIRQHAISVGYQSPCQCWGLSVMASWQALPDQRASDNLQRTIDAARERLKESARFTIFLTIADYQLGATQGQQ